MSLLQILLLSCASAGVFAEDVVTVTSSNFESTTKQGLWLVEFMAPWCGHCQQLKPIYAKAATQLKGKIGFAAVDATAEEELAQEYGISSFPTIKLFKDGEFRENFDGERSVDGFVAYYESKKNMGDRAPSEVIELTAQNFQAKVSAQPVAIVKFYAPWCGHCKALAPTWESVAAKLKPEGILVGKVDITSQSSLQQEYSISGFPTIKAFKNGKFKGDHQGARTADGIIEWMKGAVDASPKVLEKGDLDDMLKRQAHPTFVLVEGSDETRKLFNQASEREMVTGILGFATIERSILAGETASADVPKTANRQGDIFVVNSGEIVALETELNEPSITRFISDNKDTYFYDKITPGGNFNEVMYSDKMSAVIHVAEDGGLVEKGFEQAFREVSKSLRGKFVFGKMSAKEHSNLSEQVGMFKKFLPGLVIFDSKKLKYFSDRNMGRSKEDIETLLNQALEGKLPEKTPGDEKADVGRNTAAERRSSQLYDADKPPTRGAGGSKDAANRLDKHEQMLKDLIKSQTAIQEAIYQIRDEIIDLRTDIEPMSGGKFYREPVDVMSKKGSFPGEGNDPRSPRSDPHTGVLKVTPSLEKPKHEEL